MQGNITQGIGSGGRGSLGWRTFRLRGRGSLGCTLRLCGRGLLRRTCPGSETGRACCRFFRRGGTACGRCFRFLGRTRLCAHRHRLCLCCCLRCGRRRLRCGGRASLRRRSLGRNRCRRNRYCGGWGLRIGRTVVDRPGRLRQSNGLRWVSVKRRREPYRLGSAFGLGLRRKCGATVGDWRFDGAQFTCTALRRIQGVGKSALP